MASVGFVGVLGLIGMFGLVGTAGVLVEHGYPGRQGLLASASSFALRRFSSKAALAAAASLSSGVISAGSFSILML